MFGTALKERDKKMIEQGIERERLELAKKMKEEGVDIALISKITGFTVEELSEL